MEVIGQLHMLAALSPVKELLIPIEYKAVWTQGSDWMLWRREKSLAHAGN
jgi:hypothetical protein